MRTVKTITPTFILCLALSQAFAQSTPTPSTATAAAVRIIATTKTATFEKELNEAAKEGFRLTRLAKADYGSGVSGLVTQENATPQYEYRVLSTTRQTTLQKEVEQAAAEGYEVRGMTTEGNATTFTTKEITAVMERPVGAMGRRFTYKLVTAKKLQEDLDNTVAEGFVPVELFVTQRSDLGMMFSGSGSSLLLNILFSRAANSTAAPDAEYRIVWRADHTKMTEELNQLASEGFQLNLVATYPVVLMARSKQTTPQKYEYTVLADSRKNPLPKQMTEGGAQGYRFRGASYGFGVTAVMERVAGASPSAEQIEYKWIKAVRESTTREELKQAIASGFRAEEFLALGQNLLVFSRSRTTTMGVK